MNHPKIAKSALIAAIFSSSLSVLLFEMTQIHVFSRSLPPVLAYTAISLAMTGFGMGAILLSLFPSFFNRDPRRNLSLFAYLQGIAMVASTAVFARMSGAAFSGLDLAMGPLVFGILIPCTLPYFFSGLFLGLVFSAFTDGIGRLYFWNLLGSGIGTVLMAFPFTTARAEMSIYAASAISLIAALLLALPIHRRIAAGAMLTIIALTVTLPLIDKIFPFESSGADGAPAENVGAFYNPPPQNPSAMNRVSKPGNSTDRKLSVSATRQVSGRNDPAPRSAQLAKILPEAVSTLGDSTKNLLDLLIAKGHETAIGNRQAEMGFDSNYDLVSRLIGGNHQPAERSEWQLLRRFWTAIVLMALIAMVLPAVTFGGRLSSLRPLLWVFPYFFLVGMCFMMIEIGIINRFAPFIGSGSVSASIVLASILISSGLGSYSSELLKKRPETLISIGTFLLLLSALIFQEFYPRVVLYCTDNGLGLALRGLLSGLITVPLGYSMGWFFPSGLRAVSSYLKDNRLLPWAISMNGFASVFGSIAALPLSINYGFGSLFTVALVGYVFAGGLSFLVFRRQRA